MSALPSQELATEVRRRLGPAPGPSDWPLVSIVVLNRDGAARLRRLLVGLREHTDYPNLELILVDNASSDDSLDFIRQVEAPFPISILANPHNESFSDGCNQGAALAAGDLLLFLNNDVEPFEPGWLRELVACLLRSAAAAVGPTLIEPAADAALAQRYLVHQRGLRIREERGMLVPAYRDHHEDPLGAWLGEDVEVLTVVAACLLIGRAAFDRVGGFTHGYWYGPEDVDLALKLRERGMSVRCSGRSLLVHTANSTLSEIEAEQRAVWVRGNRRLFMERWGPRVRREYELDRLRAGGLWAELGPAGASWWGSTPAEVEALGFCLESPGPRSEPGIGFSLEELAAALRRRGRRAIAPLAGEAAESLAGLEYDVAVHFGGPYRYLPKLGQLNLLLPTGDGPVLEATERSRYDLVLDRDGGVFSGSAGLCAERLLEVSDELARKRGFRTRVEPSGDPALVSNR